jgi:RHS repeat-associated protein
VFVAAFAAFFPLAALAVCTNPPELSVTFEVDSTDPDDLFAVAHITNSSGQIQSYWNGNGYFQSPVFVGAGSSTHRVSMACMTGPYEFKVMLWGNPECEPAEKKSTFAQPPTHPRFTSKIGVVADYTSITLSWEYPNTGLSSNYTYVTRLHGEGGSAPVLAKRTNQEGGHGLGENGPGVIVVEGESCIGHRGVTAIPLGASQSCPETGADNSCKTCFGKPIHAVSGNMRATDEDPIAGFGEIVRFQRHYDSYSRRETSTLGPVRRGAFGSRWGSIFSASALATSTPLGTELVNVITEDNAQYVFRRTDSGSYQQLMPDRPAAATELTKLADGSWIHRDPEKKYVRVFAPGGRPTAYRDVATGREIRITWSGTDRPARVEDSWGAWALVITTSNAGYITSIAPENDPSAAWTYTYAIQGILEDGNHTERHYLVRVDSPLGKWRTYTYSDRLTSIRDGSDRLIESHAYNSLEPFAKTSIQDTDDIKSIYQDRGENAGRVPREHVTYVTYANDRVARYFSRLAAGAYRVVEIDGGCTSCGVESAVMAYDRLGNVARKQSGDGYITLREFDTSLKNVIRERTAMRPLDCNPEESSTRCRQLPDLLADVTLVPTSATVVTEYAYAGPNWPTRPTLITTSSVAKPNATRTTTLTYDASSGEVLVHSVTGSTSQPAVQETRTTTTTLYDGVVAAEFDPAGSFASSWLSLPQPRGMRSRIDGPRPGTSDVTAFVYYPVDASVTQTNRGRLAAIRNPAGHIVRFEDYDARGNAQRVIDANGVVETRTFDALGNLTASALPPIGGCDTAADPLCATALTTTRAYDTSGHLQKEMRPSGGVTVYEYDDRRRVTARSRGPAENDLRERIETVYDAATGRKSIEKTLARENGSWVEKTRTSFTYNMFARVEKATNADSTSVAYTWDTEGNVATTRDERHAAPNVFYDYDAAGRLTEVRQTLSTASGGVVTTAYSYDTAGNLTSVTDPNGNVTTYRYDDFGQMLQQVSPVTGTTVFEYDQTGNLLQSTDANGASTTRTYDVLDRVLSAMSTKSGAASETVTWVFDDATPGSFGVGRLSSMTDPTGTTDYTYERRGQLVRQTQTIRGSVYTTSFTYDADGGRKSIRYPSSRVVEYTNDYAGRPVAAASGGQPLVTSTTYLPFGPVKSVVYGNGTTRTMQYDSRYRPLENKLTSAAGTLAQYGYAHDAGGNITQISDVLNPSYTRNFDYDDLNRLVTANSGASLWGQGSFSWDAMGNMLTSNLGSETTLFNYTGSTPKLTNVTENGVSSSVTYDSAGNEIVARGAPADYSARNALGRSPRKEFAYDGRGVRTITTARVAVELTTNKPSPQKPAIWVRWTAQAAGGEAPFEYQFRRRKLPDGAWAVRQHWGTTATWDWAAEPYDLGVYEVAVGVRSAGSDAEEASHSMTFEWSLGNQAAVTSLTTDKPSPQKPAVWVVWTAEGSGGEAPLEYQFRRRRLPDGEWVVARHWATIPTWSSAVEPQDIGTYEVLAAVRSAGASLEEGSRTATFEWSLGNQATLTALTTDKPSPQKPGTGVSWTAHASGGDAPLEYRFLRRKLPDGAWMTARPWTAAATWPWTVEAQDAAIYEVAAEVRSAGANLAESTRSMTFEWKSGEYATVTALTSDKPSPQKPGITVVWTAQTSGGEAPLEYLFRVRKLPDGVWVTKRYWSTSPSLTWTVEPKDIAVYELAVAVRSTGTWYEESSQTVTFEWSLGNQAIVSALTADKPSPQKPAIYVTWTAQASGGEAPLEYLFRTRKLPDGQWVTKRYWSTSPSLTWTVEPKDVAVYELAVAVRSTGTWYEESSQTVTFEWSLGNQAIVSALTADKPSPQKPAIYVTWTAQASGGEAPLEFLFRTRKLPDGVWVTKRYWSTSPSLTWTVEPKDVGVHELAVAARSTGTYYEESSHTVTFEWSLGNQATIDTLTTDKPSPQSPGTAITWTIAASGGEAPLEYRYQYRQEGGSLHIATVWSTNPSWTWAPPHAATWEVVAAVRSAGTYYEEGTRTMAFLATTTAVIVSLTADSSSPQPAGSAITWTATAAAGTPPLQYQFERKSATATEWTIVQPYSTSAVYTWTPAAEDAGDHVVRVLVRSAGSIETFEDTAESNMTVVLQTSDAARAPVLCAGTFLEPCLPAFAVLMTNSGTSGLARYSLYSPELSLLAETAETTSGVKPIEYEYIWFGGQPLAQVHVATNAISWYFNDHLGTPILQTDSAANVVWRIEQKPFGDVQTYRAGADRHQPLAFPGQEQGEEGEASYNVFRWYRAGWGRYTQPDPVGLQAGTNLFTSVHGNPIEMIDPFGLKAELVCKNVGTGGTAIPLSRHCRLRVTCDTCPGGKPEIDVTVGMEYTGNPLYSINEWPYPSGMQGYTETWPVAIDGKECDFTKCVRAYNKLFSKGFTGQATQYVPAYSVFGPNSNTYAAKLIETCGGLGAFPPGAVGAPGAFGSSGQPPGLP